MSRVVLAIPATGSYRPWAEVTARSAGNVETVFLDWTNVDRAKMEALGTWHGSAIAWSRLFLSEILPSDVDLVISCDADVLFRGNVQALIDEVGSLRGEADAPVVWMSGDSQPPWRKHHPAVARWLQAHPEVDPGEVLCSGLTVVDLKRWREEGWQAKVEDFVRRYPDVPFLDQMALNVVFRDAKAKLPRQWGCFSGDANDDVDYDGDCAIHYVSDAPWERKGLTRLMSDAVVLWRQAAGLPTGGWRRWLWRALRATAPLWKWERHLAWHFRTALRRRPEINGMAVAARLLETAGVPKPDEAWVHGMWLPRYWGACLLAKVRGKTLVRMTHGNLDPVRLAYHGWKKRLVSPIERGLLRWADRVVATCEAERTWILDYEPRVKAVEVVDLKRFFRLDGAKGLGEGKGEGDGTVHVLYLGRRHPLKGVAHLERAVAEIRAKANGGGGRKTVDLRIVTDHFGAALEKDWAWCDVLCLPTLSENFGLVVAEALERGKRVITTDGAPAWEPPAQAAEDERWRDRIVWLRGFRNGTDADRVRLLKDALE